MNKGLDLVPGRLVGCRGFPGQRVRSAMDIGIHVAIIRLECVQDGLWFLRCGRRIQVDQRYLLVADFAVIENGKVGACLGRQVVRPRPRCTVDRRLRSRGGPRCPQWLVLSMVPRHKGL